MLPQQHRPLTDGCCHGGGAPSSSPARRGSEAAAGALSIAVWIFMPKCPLCLAAHLTLWTGLGLSFTEATLLRWSLLVASGGALFYLVARRIGMNWPRRKRSDAPTDRRR